MKATNFIYCKKTLHHYADKHNNFTEGKMYNIEDENNFKISILDEFGSIINFSKILPNTDQYKFQYHFISLQEYRKLKLKKINENI